MADDTAEQNTKVTVLLTPQTMAALEDAAALEGDTKTDTINRAIQLYCYLVAERRMGDRLFLGRRRLTAQEMSWT